MTAPLSVGLNLVYLVADSGGAGTYARELIPAILALEPDTRITAFVSRQVPDDVRGADWAGEVEFVTFPYDVIGGPQWNVVYTMGAQWLVEPVMTARRRLDVIHGLANIVPVLQPRAATVVTLLDLIWLRFPQTMPWRATWGMKLAAIPSAHAADRVLAISEAGRRDIIDRIHLDPAGVDVTHLGVRLTETVEPAPEATLREELDLGRRPVVLCVAQKREHKNLGALIRAIADFPESERPMLVLAGAPTGYEERLRALAAELGVAGSLRLPAWMPPDRLEGLYALAACFVLPSLEEGFGLPLLEAMRRDVPVACSNVSSMPEVAGDAALLFDPHDPVAIRKAIARLITDREEAARLVERGRQRCRVFTWEATAGATLAGYRRAIDDRRRRGRPRLLRRGTRP
jgi:glycosyltransferase involved in cell wall biosynthesis